MIQDTNGSNLVRQAFLKLWTAPIFVLSVLFFVLGTVLVLAKRERKRDDDLFQATVQQQITPGELVRAYEQAAAVGVSGLSLIRLNSVAKQKPSFSMLEDNKGSMVVGIEWGGGFGHWGILIGPHGWVPAMDEVWQLKNWTNQVFFFRSP